MPIIDIEIVLRSGESVRDGLAAEIANSAGAVFGSPHGGTWVKIHPISAEHYAENGAGPDEAVFPVFVSILKSRHPDNDAMKAEIAALTNAIAKACDRPPENVHIIYELEAAGRAAFGGKIVSYEL